MSANLQYKKLISFCTIFGSCQGGVHQEQKYISRPTKINGITLFLYVNYFLGYIGDWYRVFTLDREHVCSHL